MSLFHRSHRQSVMTSESHRVAKTSLASWPRAGALVSAAIFSLLLATGLSIPATLRAAQNPFEQVAEASYAGRFSGPDVTLRLKPDGGKWSGTILFKGKNYAVQGENKEGTLQGTGGEGDQTWPFSAKSDGDNLTFTAGTFTTQLQRQKLPKLEGIYQSKRVKLEFQNKESGINGVITFNAKQFQFAAVESAGDLEGVFKSGEEAFKFTLVNDPSGLTFQTGTFSETVRWSPARLAASKLGAQERWTNSLGMVLVRVPGTDVLFCIWDTRVRDYQVYAEAGSGVDAGWKTPGFPQDDTHPVVNVSWNDAKAFCKWLTEQERTDGILSLSQSYRLPTDTEWSVAVGLGGESGSTPDDKSMKIKDVYPWGTQWPPPNDVGNYDDYSSSAISGLHDGYARTSPVG
jgi:hypothetical protein